MPTPQQLTQLYDAVSEFKLTYQIEQNRLEQDSDSTLEGIKAFFERLELPLESSKENDDKQCVHETLIQAIEPFIGISPIWKYFLAEQQYLLADLTQDNNLNHQAAESFVKINSSIIQFKESDRYVHSVTKIASILNNKKQHETAYSIINRTEEEIDQKSISTIRLVHLTEQKIDAFHEMNITVKKWTGEWENTVKHLTNLLDHLNNEITKTISKQNQETQRDLFYSMTIRHAYIYKYPDTQGNRLRLRPIQYILKAIALSDPPKPLHLKNFIRLSRLQYIDKNIVNYASISSYILNFQTQVINYEILQFLYIELLINFESNDLTLSKLLYGIDVNSTRYWTLQACSEIFKTVEESHKIDGAKTLDSITFILSQTEVSSEGKGMVRHFCDALELALKHINDENFPNKYLQKHIQDNQLLNKYQQEITALRQSIATPEEKQIQTLTEKVATMGSVIEAQQAEIEKLKAESSQGNSKNHSPTLFS